MVRVTTARCTQNHSVKALRMFLSFSLLCSALLFRVSGSGEKGRVSQLYLLFVCAFTTHQWLVVGGFNFRDRSPLHSSISILISKLLNWKFLGRYVRWILHISIVQMLKIIGIQNIWNQCWVTTTHTHKHNAQKTHCSVIIILHVTQSMPRATTASTLKTVRTYTVRFERKFNVPLSLPFLFVFFSCVAVLLSSDTHTTHEHAPRPLKGTNLFQTIFSLSMFVSDNPTKERNEIAALHRW